MRVVEFICVNSSIPDATTQNQQNNLFEGLKDVKKLVVYKQNYAKHNSLAAIINTPHKKEMLLIMREIKKCAQKHNVQVDFIQEVTRDFVNAVKSEKLECLTDFYKT